MSESPKAGPGFYAACFIVYAVAMTGLAVFLKAMNGDFVLGFSAGGAFMTGLLFFISPRIRKTLSE